MKIAIASNINVDFLGEYMERYLSNHGIEAEIYLSGFNQIAQEVLDPNSSAKRFDPDYFLIFLDIEEYLWELLLDKALTDHLKEEAMKKVEELIEIFEKASDEFKYILVNNVFIRPIGTALLEYNTGYSLKELEMEINRKLLEIARRRRNIYIVDYKSMIEEWGWKNLYDSKLFYLGSIRFNKKGFEELAKLYGRYIRSISGKIKKVLVLDADGVLWGGIIGEDGISGIKLDVQKEGRIYRDFQRVVAGLNQKGIVLALNSKNNEEDVKEVFKNHQGMVLKEEDFAVMKINWRDKVTNMMEISKELNLGLDSFVFIDDSEFERGFIKRELPQVVVPDFPEDVSKLLEFIDEIEREYFPKVKLTEEDKKRGQMYKAQVKREELRKRVKTLDDFLRSLKMRMYVGLVDNNTIGRVAQLTQRTNQFNMTTRRYTEEDIRRMEEEGYKIYWMRLEDKFGDNGIVGVIIIGYEGNKARIDTFLMSCRVIGRKAEDAFIWYVEEEMMKEGIEEIEAEYIPTKKNTLVKEKYEELGYKLVEEKEGGKYYRKKLPEEHLNKPKWIEIKGV